MKILRYVTLLISTTFALNSFLFAGPAIENVIKKIEPSLFIVLPEDGSSGSGFLYKNQKTVVTNRHVVESVQINERVRLKPIVDSGFGFKDLGDPFYGVLVFKHPDLDIAIINLETISLSEPIEPITLNSISFLPRGTDILAHGFPSTQSPMISTGVISGHYRHPLTNSIYYLTDASLASGSSGGPVTDMDGNLIGIATAIHVNEFDEGFNWGYVIPVHIMEQEISFTHQSRMLLDIDALVGKIAKETIYAARLDRGIESYETIVNGSGTHLELFENTVEFLSKSESYFMPYSISNSKALIQFKTNFHSLFYIRFLQLGFQSNFVYSDDVSEYVDNIDNWSLSIQEKMFAIATAKDDALRDAFLEHCLDYYISQARTSLAQLEKSCQKFDNIDYTDSTWYRNLKQSDLIDSAVYGFSIVETESAYEDLSELISNSTNVSSSVRDKLRSLELTQINIQDSELECLAWILSLVLGPLEEDGSGDDQGDLSEAEHYHYSQVEDRIQEGYTIYRQGEGQMNAYSNSGLVGFEIPASNVSRDFSAYAIGFGSDLDLLLWDSSVDYVSDPNAKGDLLDEEVAPEFRTVG